MICSIHMNYFHLVPKYTSKENVCQVCSQYSWHLSLCLCVITYKHLKFWVDHWVLLYLLDVGVDFCIVSVNLFAISIISFPSQTTQQLFVEI